MNDVTNHSALVEEVRALKGRLEAEQRRSTAIEAQFNLASEQLLKITVERDYYRNFSSILCAKAEVLQDVSSSILKDASENAKLMMVEQAESAGQQRARDEKSLGNVDRAAGVGAAMGGDPVIRAGAITGNGEYLR